MSALSLAETAICELNPIGRRLDALRDEFLAKYPSNDLDWQKTVRSDGDTVKQLISSLQSLPAAARLPSRHSTGKLDLDLATILFPLVDRGLDVEKTAVLLERVIKPESDHNIWCAVYDLVASAISATPPPQPYLISPTLTRIKDTPRRAGGSSGIVNSSEHRKDMDSQIRKELSDHIYKDVPEFVQKIFVDSIPGLKARAEEMLENCKQQSLYDGQRWTSFPGVNTPIEKAPTEKVPTETDVASWLAQIIETIGKGVECFPSRILHSEPNKPLPGPKAKRKPDLGFYRTNPLGFRDVLVLGELKSNPKEARRAGVCHDLARYVREIYGTQDTRRFVHGFTICGDLMTVYLFDRGAVYAAPEFSANGDALQFVTVMLGYLLMNEEQLGFDTSVQHDGTCRFIEVAGERFVLDELLFRQPGIVCRGTTCWKVTAKGKTYVIKDSWQYEPGRDEAEILGEVTAGGGVDNIAGFHAAETVKIAGMDDDLFVNVRRGLEVNVGKIEDTERASEEASRNTTSRKRSAGSAGLWVGDDDETRGSVKRRKGSFVRPVNRIHKRIVMTKAGKPLHHASKRKAVLQGLIGGLSGHQQLFEAGVLHRDISIGNVLLSEDETIGFLIDLDHAIRVNREEKSGAGARTGTSVFMSIQVLDPVEDEHVHSFMDDVESMFWLLFWICIHYISPGDKVGRQTQYEQWNFISDQALADAKRGIAYMPEAEFIARANQDFTKYYRPLVETVAELKKVMFPGNARWVAEDMDVYDRAKGVLRRAMENTAIDAKRES